MKLAHARERFYRGAHRDGAGFGLGLAIVETIKRPAGGNLSLVNLTSGGFNATLHFPKA